MSANAKRACLGVSAFYQDSAAALVADGDIITLLPVCHGLTMTNRTAV